MTFRPFEQLYEELRSLIERTLEEEGNQGLDSLYMTVGPYRISSYIGDGDPCSVSMKIPELQGVEGNFVKHFYVLDDTSGEFKREYAREALDYLRRRRVLNELADI